MRRLSKGARLIATIGSNSDADQIILKVSEVNGVSVTLTSGDMIFRQHNRFAKSIALFLWKVPSSIEHRSSIPLDPVKICGSTTNIQIPMGTIGKSIIDHMVGAKFETIVTINGYDEMGRAVNVKIEKAIQR